VCVKPSSRHDDSLPFFLVVLQPLLSWPLRYLTIITWHVTKQSSLRWRPIHFHSLVLAVFASLIAPFGGFFASIITLNPYVILLFAANVFVALILA
jgi:hypothetical protein